MVRRSSAFLAAIAATAVLAIPAAAQAATAQAAMPTGPATVDLATTAKLGAILTNSMGRTLYAFTKDTPNTDTCVMTLGCPLFWPPLLTDGAPIAGPGVNASLLGTISLSGGRMQVTYNGYPLYGFLLNIFPHMTLYVGIEQFGGKWDAVNAAGSLVP